MLGRASAAGHPAVTDRETGLANGLHFELVYRYLFLCADRGIVFTVMLLSFPDPALDSLKAVGERIRGTMRTVDLVSHLGSGRFAVLLLGSNLPGGRLAADRLEGALKDVTAQAVSIGLAAYDANMKEPADLIQAVEGALERARRSGGGIEMAI